MINKIIDFVQELSIVCCVFVMIGLVGGFEKNLSTLGEMLAYMAITLFILVVDVFIYLMRKAGNYNAK